MEIVKAPTDPEKNRPFFYIIKDKEIFSESDESGKGVSFLYQSDGRLTSSAGFVGNVTDDKMIKMLESVEGFKKLVHSVGVSVEMKDKDCRPPLMDTDAPVAEADLIFLGYPVWWYREPSIIDSFLDAYDFKGKKIVLFATSGTSGIGEEAPQRIARLSGAEVLPGKRCPADVSAEELKAWTETC